MVLGVVLGLVLGLALATGCASSTGTLDGGAALDVATVEGGTIRPDAASDAAPLTDARAPDGGTLCSGACDPREPIGCPGLSACSLGTGVPDCVTALGTGERGEPCASVDECGAGLGCFRERATGLGVCERVCCPYDGGGCAAGERCGGAGELIGGQRTSWGFCAPVRTCGVLDPLSCSEREACFIVDAAGTTECRIAGAAAAGAACERPEDCAGGLFCGGLGARTCLVVCSIAAMRSCPDGMRCVAQSYSPTGSGICTRDPAP